MRAARRNQKYFASLAAIEREVLAHDAKRHRATDFQIDAVIDWLPEPTHIGARGRAWRGRDEVVGEGRQTANFFGLRHSILQLHLCELSEAIQSSGTAPLDCFVASLLTTLFDAQSGQLILMLFALMTRRHFS